MDKKTIWKLRWGAIREYLPTFKKPLSSKKGSPTLEYVVIIAVGAAFAGLLLSAFGGKDNPIKKALKDKVETTVKDSGNVTKGGGGDNKDKPKDEQKD